MTTSEKRPSTPVPARLIAARCAVCVWVHERAAAEPDAVGLVFDAAAAHLATTGHAVKVSNHRCTTESGPEVQFMTRPSRPWWKRVGALVCEYVGSHAFALPADRCPFCRAVESGPYTPATDSNYPQPHDAQEG